MAAGGASGCWACSDAVAYMWVCFDSMLGVIQCRVRQGCGVPFTVCTHANLYPQGVTPDSKAKVCRLWIIPWSLNAQLLSPVCPFSGTARSFTATVLCFRVHIAQEKPTLCVSALGENHPRCMDPSIGQWLLLAPRPARSLVVTAHRTNVGFPVCVFNHSPSPATVGMQSHSSFTNAWSEWYSPVVYSVDDTCTAVIFSN
jgi:hypothetical protein